MKTYLLKLVTLHSRNGCPEASHTLSRIVSCNIIYLFPVARLVFIMREMEAISAVGMEFQETRSYNAILQVYRFASNVAFSFQDKSRLVRDNEVVFHKLAIEDVAAVREEREPARHIARPT